MVQDATTLAYNVTHHSFFYPRSHGGLLFKQIRGALPVPNVPQMVVPLQNTYSIEGHGFGLPASPAA